MTIALLVLGAGVLAFAVAAAADRPLDEADRRAIRRTVIAALALGAALIGGGIWSLMG